MFLTIPSERIRYEMEKIEVHPMGMELMAPKASVEPLKLLQIRTPAANILKQEMLRQKCSMILHTALLFVPYGTVFISIKAARPVVKRVKMWYADRK